MVGVVVVGVVTELGVGAFCPAASAGSVDVGVAASGLVWGDEAFAGLACWGDCTVALRPAFCRIWTSCSKRLLTLSRASMRS